MAKPNNVNSCAVLVFAAGSKRANGTKIVLVIPSIIAGGVATEMAGLFLGVPIDMAMVLNSPFMHGMAHSCQSERLRLRLAACANEVVTVRAQLAYPLDDAGAGDVALPSVNFKTRHGGETFHLANNIMPAATCFGKVVFLLKEVWSTMAMQFKANYPLTNLQIREENRCRCDEQRAGAVTLSGLRTHELPPPPHKTQLAAKMRHSNGHKGSVWL